MEDKIQNLHNQVNSLQDRIRVLETTLENSKYALSRTRIDEKTPFTSQQGNSTLKDKKSSYLTQNDREVRKEKILQSEQQSNVLSEASKSPLKTLTETQQYNPYHPTKIKALTGQISSL